MLLCCFHHSSTWWAASTLSWPSSVYPLPGRLVLIHPLQAFPQILMFQWSVPLTPVFKITLPPFLAFQSHCCIFFSKAPFIIWHKTKILFIVFPNLVITLRAKHFCFIHYCTPTLYLTQCTHSDICKTIYWINTQRNLFLFVSMSGIVFLQSIYQQLWRLV